MPDTDLIKLTGLWRNQGKDGNDYFTGTLGGARVLIFANKYKELPKHPDMVLYLAPKKERDEAQVPEPDPDEGIPF